MLSDAGRALAAVGQVSNLTVRAFSEGPSESETPGTGRPEVCPTWALLQGQSSGREQRRAVTGFRVV